MTLCVQAGRLLSGVPGGALAAGRAAVPPRGLLAVSPPPAGPQVSSVPGGAAARLRADRLSLRPVSADEALLGTRGSASLR